jgi:hypothetical protein
MCAFCGFFLEYNVAVTAWFVVLRVATSGFNKICDAAVGFVHLRHDIPYPIRKRTSPGQHHAIMGCVGHSAHDFPVLSRLKIICMMMDGQCKFAAALLPRSQLPRSCRAMRCGRLRFVWGLGVIGGGGRIVLRNKGILHLGARGHQEAPVHQWHCVAKKKGSCTWERPGTRRHHAHQWQGASRGW